MSKKLQAKQERRRAEQRRRDAQRRAARRGNLVTVGIAVAVAAVVAVLVWQGRAAENAPVGGDAAEAGCTPIETHPIEGQEHVEQGTDVTYETTPPTSGNHFPTPADPGFYPSPIAEEALVHNLEHGQIVIWYRAGASQDTIDDIEQIVDQEPITTLAAPYEGVEEPHDLVLTGWGTSQSCSGVSQEVVDRFRTRFQGRGPETVPGIPPFAPSES
ncbi:hypothetical protein BH24ACT26_BH24ACT26_05080 [soil metagenome]